MVPGVSRSGATIMGALAMGIERRTAAEFSFFLAIPTMVGATALELWDSRAQLAAGTGVVGLTEIAVGFAVSFVVALAVIKLFVAYVSRAGFAPFAWYRIVAGQWRCFALAELTAGAGQDFQLPPQDYVGQSSLSPIKRPSHLIVVRPFGETITITWNRPPTVPRCPARLAAGIPACLGAAHRRCRSRRCWHR
jgi:hypothetical protein